MHTIYKPDKVIICVAGHHRLVVEWEDEELNCLIWLKRLGRELCDNGPTCNNFVSSIRPLASKATL